MPTNPIEPFNVNDFLVSGCIPTEEQVYGDDVVTLQNPYKTNAYDDELHKLQKFYDDGGWLSEWAFQCGYMEQYNVGNHVVNLWFDSACYSVRHHIYGVGRQCWESFDTDDLNGAREFFLATIMKARMMEESNETTS